MARIHVDIELRWADQDAYGHINNVAYARYLEEARVRLFFEGNTREDAGLKGLFRDDTPDGKKMLVAHQEIAFRRVLEYSKKPLTIEMWFGKIGGSSVELHYELVTNDPDRTVVAQAVTTAVIVDGSSLRPRRLEPEARAAIEPWTDEPLALRR